MQKPKLTVRQRKFAMHYIKTGIGGESALKAGYSPNCKYETAHELLRNPKIQQYIELTMQEASKKLGLTPEYLLGKLKLGIDRSLPEFGDVDITFDRLKQISDTKAAVSCISEINRMLGNYAPEKKDTHHKLEGLQDLIDQCKNNDEQ